MRLGVAATQGPVSRGSHLTQVRWELDEDWGWLDAHPDYWQSAEKAQSRISKAEARDHKMDLSQQ
jgi:hypothetical protein